MKTDAIEYHDGDVLLEGYRVTHDDGQPRPGVLISHAWSGLNDFEKDKAHAIAELGYNTFALDMYGKGVRGSNIEENRELMGQFLKDRALLRQRILAGFNTMKEMDVIDETKTAAMGFCFGGLCVLDLARSGADVKGVASFHGMFEAPEDLPNEIIKAKVLALHGYDDPMVPPERVLDLAKEMSDAGVDWQIHAYGLTYHAFTNPAANDPGSGFAYSGAADRRSWETLQNFLTELFE